MPAAGSPRKSGLFDAGACKPVGVCSYWGKFWAHGEGELVAELVWRVKLAAELQAGVTTEVEVDPPSFSWLFHTLRGGERSPGTDKILTSGADFGLGWLRSACLTQPDRQPPFLYGINDLPSKPGGLAPRKARESRFRRRFTLHRLHGLRPEPGSDSRWPNATGAGYRVLRHKTYGINQRRVSTLISAVTRWMFTLPLGPVSTLTNKRA